MKSTLRWLLVIALLIGAMVAMGHFRGGTPCGNKAVEEVLA